MVLKKHDQNKKKVKYALYITILYYRFSRNRWQSGSRSFVVTFDKNSRNRYGLRAVPKFYITQYQSEQSDIFFKKIQQYFGCGHITASRYDNCYYYRISSRQQLLDKTYGQSNQTNL